MSNFTELVDFIQRERASARPAESPRPGIPTWLEDALLPQVNLIEDLTDDDLLEIPENLTSPELSVLGDPNLGVDVLAYYLPFHFYGPRWGIYLRASGIVVLATILARGGPVFGRNSKVVAVARQALFEHEFFHCLAETAVSRLEVLPTWFSISPAGMTWCKPVAYATYFKDKAAAETEEALANAQLWVRGLRGASPSMKCACATFMGSQGPGYRDYQKWSRVLTLIDGKREMIANLAKLAGIARPVYICPMEFLFENVQKPLVPTRLVNDTRLRLGRELLVHQYNGLSVRIDGNLNHGRPHVHVDHGRNRHTASYAIDDATRLAGDLDTHHDRAVRRWIEQHRQPLLRVWEDIRTGKSVEAVVGELKRSDFG